MNDKTGRSSKLRLLLLFLMPGIIILTVVFEIQTNIEKNRANTDASVIINFMKEECVRYENKATPSAQCRRGNRRPKHTAVKTKTAKAATAR